LRKRLDEVKGRWS